MFCPNCGTNNPDGSKFCSECGTVFESVKAPDADTPAPTVDEILGEIKSEPVAQPAPVEPEQPAPVEPEQPAPAEPEQPAPVEPEQPAPVEPEQPAPVGLAKSAPVPEPASVPVPEPAPVMEQSVPVPEQPAPQVTAHVQPAAPTMPQQPMPQYQQPVAPVTPAAPVAPKPPKPPRKPLDAKQKKLLLIGGSCGAVLIAFLIVLFAAIIPHSGLKGKLRYSWTRVDSTRSVNVLDLKKKRWTYGGTTYKITSWNAKGDRVQFNYTDGLSFDSDTFVVAFSPDGKKIYLFDAYGYDDGDRPEYVFARGSAVQSNNIGDLLW